MASDATIHLTLPNEAIQAFCQQWNVAELCLFGSALTDRFGPESDIDLLVSFRPGSTWSAFDLVDMQFDLENIFGRPVDLVEREGLRNPYRRRAILDEARVIYENR